jgi:3,4-dihydroxy 2-butanone 4-phosphate synthase/GTP cyclohydrolase II
MLQVNREVCARIPTALGEFRLCLYTNTFDDKEHLALVMGEVSGREDVLVRVHSECLTGDLIGSQRCDCGEQLSRSLASIAAEGQGVLIYLRQEGRGIGLRDKLRAYNLQDEGFDTVDANLILGHQADERDFTAAPLILGDLEIASVRLLTNNPDKIEALRSLGVPVSSRVAINPDINPENARYLHTKAARMNHFLNLTGRTGGPDPNGRGDEPQS